jgi:hypothetical protein
MTFGTRFLVSLVIVLTALLGLSLCGYNYWEPAEQKSGLLDYMLASAETSEPYPCMDKQSRDQVYEIAVRAMDAALHDHVKLLFENWMKDSRSQPERARVGMRNGIIAHQKARVLASEWVPPLCPG